jgi:hypothetical protein
LYSIFIRNIDFWFFVYVADNIPDDIDEIFDEYSKFWKVVTEQYSSPTGEQLREESFSRELLPVQRAVIFDQAVKKMINVIETIGNALDNEILKRDPDVDNTIRELTPADYVQVKQDLELMIDDYLIGNEDSCRRNENPPVLTNENFGDDQESSPDLAESWERITPKEIWKADNQLKGIELNGITTSFAWLSLFTQSGFKSKLTFAPPVNTRVGELAEVFKPDKLGDKSLAERVTHGSDGSVNDRQVAIIPVYVGKKGIGHDQLPSTVLKSTSIGPAKVDITSHNGNGFWERSKADVKFFSKDSLAFPVTQAAINRTLVLLNNTTYISGPKEDLDLKVSWEYIFKRRDLTTMEALKYFIVVHRLPPMLVVTSEEFEDGMLHAFLWIRKMEKQYFEFSLSLYYFRDIFLHIAPFEHAVFVVWRDYNWNG